jgi:hypothetical protein
MFEEGRHEGRALARETEWFLVGRPAEHIYLDGGAVPLWAWMNLLAHGTVEDLRSRPGTFPDAPRSLQPWVAARRYLADEVLDVVDHGSALLTVQREALIPLELDLMHAPADLCPADWVGMVTSALERRAARRRALGWT